MSVQLESKLIRSLLIRKVHSVPGSECLCIKLSNWAVQFVDEQWITLSKHCRTEEKLKLKSELLVMGPCVS